MGSGMPPLGNWGGSIGMRTSNEGFQWITGRSSYSASSAASSSSERPFFPRGSCLYVVNWWTECMSYVEQHVSLDVAKRCKYIVSFNQALFKQSEALCRHNCNETVLAFDASKE